MDHLDRHIYRSNLIYNITKLYKYLTKLQVAQFIFFANTDICMD